MKGERLHVDGDSLDVAGMRITVCPWWDGPVTRAEVEQQLIAARPPSGTPWVWVYHAPPDNRTVVVNVDPRESSTARMTREEFLGMLSKVDVPAAAAVAGRALQIESRQNYWRYGLVLMLLALVAESFVGRADRMYAPARK